MEDALQHLDPLVLFRKNLANVLLACSEVEVTRKIKMFCIIFKNETIEFNIKTLTY